MKVQVLEGAVRSREVKARTGRTYVFRSQTGMVRLGREVREIEISLGDEQAAYSPGEYNVLDSSYEVDRYGRLGIGRLALEPVRAGVATVAGAKVG